MYLVTPHPSKQGWMAQIVDEDGNSEEVLTNPESGDSIFPTRDAAVSAGRSHPEGGKPHAQSQ